MQILPFSESCEGCEGYCEITTSSHREYLVMCSETAMVGDKVQCTRCECSGKIVSGIYGNYVEWYNTCHTCEKLFSEKLAILTQRIVAELGVDSVVITRERAS